MTAKELIEQLQKVAPDTEIIGGTWNGHGIAEDRRVIWRMHRVLDMHRAKEWKKEQIYKILADFGKQD